MLPNYRVNMKKVQIRKAYWLKTWKDLVYYTECLEQYWFPAITQDECRGLVDSGHE